MTNHTRILHTVDCIVIKLCCLHFFNKEEEVLNGFLMIFLAVKQWLSGLVFFIFKKMTNYLVWTVKKFVCYLEDMQYIKFTKIFSPQISKRAISDIGVSEWVGGKEKIFRVSRGKILRHPENCFPQTIVFRNKEIGDKLCGKHRKKSYMFLSKYYLDRNNTIASLFRTQYTPDFLIAEY
jgi:hypothetical protein